MKKIALILAVVLSLVTLSASVAAEMPLRVVVNGNKLNFPDAQPFIDSNGRTQTPARFIGEALGAEVTWDGSLQKATFVKESKTLVLYIGNKEYEVDEKKLQMDTAALLQEGRTFVPARYVAEAFGATVRWDSAIKTVYIDVNGSVAPSPQTSKDPVMGWIKVGENFTYVEYEISIAWTPDAEILNKRYDAAEKMFSDRYGEEISKEVFRYLRNKKLRWDELQIKQYKLGSKVITAEASGGEVLLQVWKEGIEFQ